jgi:hypothetical protein
VPVESIPYRHILCARYVLVTGTVFQSTLMTILTVHLWQHQCSPHVPDISSCMQHLPQVVHSGLLGRNLNPDNAALFKRFFRVMRSEYTK